MSNKPKSVYLTDRSMSALRHGEALSGRMNQVVDRYLKIIELTRRDALAFFTPEHWAVMLEANDEIREQKALPALDQVHALVAALGAHEIAIAMERMPAWQTFVFMELLEEDAAGVAV